MNCPYCNSSNIKKAGKNYKNTQRYKCNNCSKYFLETINDIFYHSSFTKEDLFLVIEEMLTSKKSNLNFSDRTKRLYKHLIFEYLKYYYSKIKLSNRVLVYDMSFKYVSSNNRHINSLLLCLNSNDEIVLIYLDNPKLRKKNLIHYVEPFIERHSELIYERLTEYFPIINDLELDFDCYWSKVEELMAFDIFYDNKVALNGLKEYLKTIPNLTKQNISNYVRLYNYFLQLKGSVKDKINYMINSQNFKDFFKNYSKTT